jgi:two-component system, OmpR family, sensor histidine kinase SenX3
VAVLLLITGLIVGGTVGAIAARAWYSRAPSPGELLGEPSDEMSAEADVPQRASSLDHPGLSRLRLAFDALPVGVVLADADGTVLFRNEVARHVSGRRHADVLVDEAVETHLMGALHGEHRSQTLDLYGPPRKVVLIRTSPIDNGRGGALATIEDITERSLVDAVRTDFVANISHELKTPVGAMTILAETLADSDDPAIVQRLSSKIVREAERLANMIDDLLELSRIELGGEAVREVVAAGLVMAEAVERVRPLAERRDITLHAREPSGRLKLLGDRRQLVSALGNLVENAVKYSETGGEVEVRAATSGSWIDLTVIDHGIGIPTRDLERVFERFYRVDRARSRETGGTGLGLAIVRHVATNHGGRVTVQSVEGEGSTFVLRIPIGPGVVAVQNIEDDPARRPAAG